MKVAFVGQKGIPATQGGGVENYVENLSTQLVKRGFEVIAYNRKRYADPGKQYKGVQIAYTPSLSGKYFETITHVVSSLVHALFVKDLDVFHVNSVGPALVIPFARVGFFVKRILTGQKTFILFTFHSEDWFHGKWGGVSKLFLRLGAWAGCRFSHEVITVSKSLRQTARQEFGRNAVYIPNGATFHTVASDRYIQKFGLKTKGYIVYVARLIPHKNPHVLIEAFQDMKQRYGKKLVIVGGASHTSDYEKKLHQMAKDDPDIIFTGHQSGKVLRQLFANAAVYVLPSDSEGLSISLLEAASYGVPIIVSNIPQNREVVGNLGKKVAPRNVKSLSRALESVLEDYRESMKKARALQEIVKVQYAWDSIADQTAQVLIDMDVRYSLEQPIFTYK